MLEIYVNVLVLAKFKNIHDVGGNQDSNTNLKSVEYSNSFPFVENTIKATSASQRTESSLAFLSNPDRRFENVT